MVKLVEDITGRRYGRLVVKEHIYGSHWRVVCDCGVEKIVQKNVLGTRTNSCGCLKREYVANKNYKHGGCSRNNKERLYAVWRNILCRCHDESNNRYKNYGARGITVCSEWEEYENFRKWAYENGYDPEAQKFACTIDRIDVNGNYCPDNCRFISNKEQAMNKTSTHWLSVDGKKMSMKEVSDEYEVPYSRLNYRINKGWSIEDALFAPTQRKE